MSLCDATLQGTASEQGKATLQAERARFPAMLAMPEGRGALPCKGEQVSRARLLVVPTHVSVRRYPARVSK